MKKVLIATSLCLALAGLLGISPEAARAYGNNGPVPAWIYNNTPHPVRTLPKASVRRNDYAPRPVRRENRYYASSASARKVYARHYVEPYAKPRTDRAYFSAYEPAPTWRWVNSWDAVPALASGDYNYWRQVMAGSEIESMINHAYFTTIYQAHLYARKGDWQEANALLKALNLPPGPKWWLI